MLTNEMSLRMAEEYRRKGYIVLPGVLSDELVRTLRGETERVFAAQTLVDDFNIRAEARRDVSDQWVVDRLDPVVDLSPAFLDAVSQPLLLEVLQELLGDVPQLLKCKLIRKEPNVGGYRPHQDYLYWRWLNLRPNCLCSVSIALYRSDAESGGLELFPGLHDKQISGPGGSMEKDCDLDGLGSLKSEVPTLQPGDALIFHSLTPHRSGPNRSAQPRTVLLPSYVVSTESDLYLKYYRREIERRARDHVGFERFEQQHGQIRECFKTRTARLPV